MDSCANRLSLPAGANPRDLRRAALDAIRRIAQFGYTEEQLNGRAAPTPV
jgi:hypothetical protein